MYMLCLITYKVRSENGYGFLRPSLKTGMGNKVAFFGLKLGLDLEMRAAHPHQTGGGGANSWRVIARHDVMA